MDIREKLATALGWEVEASLGLSLRMLVELVRGKNPQLARELAEEIERGEHLFVRHNRKRRYQ